MDVKTIVKTSEYHDSVSLMLAARELAKIPGITDAAVVMGTEANKAILREAGLLTPEASQASPNDLVISASGEAGALEHVIVEAEKVLAKKAAPAASGGPGGYLGEFQPKTLRGAAKANPQANLAVISVAGRFAAGEAWEALHQGLHVLLFSDNVSLEDEITLKKYAVQNGLLLMGPGAGTAIINGVALGFANAIPSGPVGIVSAAGTGLQEVSCLLARQGIGITQGIGTGGRDLKEEVGGLMFLSGLQALQEDPQTEVILLVSKPSAPAVERKVLDQVARSEKPAVVCLLGGRSDLVDFVSNGHFARTLQEAALAAARLAGAPIQDAQAYAKEEEQRLKDRACELSFGLKPRQRYIRGLFSGGTLCYEAQVIWQDLVDLPVLSNAPLLKENQVPDSSQSVKHTAIDLGEEEFTVGRPHPMIDNDLRIRRLLQEARDPEVAVILLDVVLGYGAHPDPACELAPAVTKARQVAASAGQELVFIASVTGTENDPQRYSRQVKELASVGVEICQSNASAARLAAFVIGR